MHICSTYKIAELKKRYFDCSSLDNPAYQETDKVAQYKTIKLEICFVSPMPITLSTFLFVFTQLFI